MEEGNKYSYYLHDLGAELRQMADDALRRARGANKYDREQRQGELFTFVEVLSLMQQQADTFDIPHSELGLEGLDPDNDLLVGSERPTPKKRRDRGHYTWDVRVGRLRLLFILLAHREPRDVESVEDQRTRPSS
jgi:hypothetical protein